MEIFLINSGKDRNDSSFFSTIVGNSKIFEALYSKGFLEVFLSASSMIRDTCFQNEGGWFKMIVGYSS